MQPSKVEYVALIKKNFLHGSAKCHIFMDEQR